MAVARTFLLLGSGEFEPWSEASERAALERAPVGPILVVPTASATEGDGVFDRWGTMGLEHYAAMGLNAELLEMRSRADAFRDELAAQVDRASMLFCSGGKPKHLAAVLDGSPVWDAMLRSLDRGAVYAGCSAGAMVASQARPAGSAKRPRGGWVFGLGLVPHASFGVHWDKVRFVPFLQTITMALVPDGTSFVGIEERTAIVGDGRSWEVHGLKRARVRRARTSRTYGAGERFQT